MITPQENRRWLIYWTVASGVVATIWLLVVLYYVSPKWVQISVGVSGCGGLMALAQSWLMPITLRHERLDWVVYSFFGSLAGGVVLWAATWFGDELTGSLGCGLCIGIAQWSVLRDSAIKVRRWIPASGLSFLIVGVVFFIALAARRSLLAFDYSVGFWLFIPLFAVGTFACAYILGHAMGTMRPK